MLSFGNNFLSTGQQLVPFQPEHLSHLELKGDELHFADLIPNYYQYILDNAIPELAWTGIRDGKPVLIFGLRPYWVGVAEVWMVPGRGIERNPIALIKGARQILAQIEQKYNMKRLQIAVRKHNDTAYNFAKSLYFTVESVMTKFGPDGDDYLMMTRIR